jgi:hypothetical protein
MIYNIYAVLSDNTYYRSKFPAITEGVLVQNKKNSHWSGKDLPADIPYIFA